jgi:diguanylate cyclase (GGDEF)-like protein
MRTPSDGLPRRPMTSLATKIILFVFGATFVSAALVSWAAVDASYDQIRTSVARHYPLAAASTARELRGWLDAGRAELEALARGSHLPRSLPPSEHFDGLAWLGAGGRPEHRLGTAATLDGADWSPRDGPLVEIGGRVAALWPRDGAGGVAGLYREDALESLLAASLPDTTAQAHLHAADPGAPAGVQERRGTHGGHVIAVSQPLGLGDWRVEIEVPFERVFAPVLSFVARLFLIDLLVVLAFSFLAYQLTNAVVRPIEVLSDGARRIAQGDFGLEIPEPDTTDELGLLTRTFNDMMRRLRRDQAEIEAANRTLLSRNEILSQLSITDGLTHLHNHRFFQDHLTREIKRVSRVQEPLSMLMIDIDDFKRLNDRLGHAAGDELLAGMARIMGNCVRESDLLARYGGEEFVVLTPNTDRSGAYLLAEKIRTNIAESSFILDDSLRPTRITVSVGVAQFEGNRKRFFEAADRALYRAKAAGKNCVMPEVPDADDPPEDAVAT